MRFLIGGFHPDIDLDMVIGLEGAKIIYVLLRPDLGVWRMLEVPDWGFAS